MVRALGHSSLVVTMALILLPSMPTLPIYAVSPQSVQYSHLEKKRTEKERKIKRQDLRAISSVYLNDFASIKNIQQMADYKKQVHFVVYFWTRFYYFSHSCG